MSQLLGQPESWLANFGLSQFRPGQKLVIEAIFAGRDTLCIMPTGGGKSLCYQLPAIAREGVTIVISPLIALMKDQVDALTEIDIPATLINSTVSADEQQARIGGMIRGDYKLIYIAPERLRSSSFMRAVQKTKIQLLAIDEAHCISQWGHDFRPDYARLGRFRERIGNPQTVALTATATKLVQEDIATVLRLENPSRFVTGFARDNLSIGVASPKANSEKDQRLLDFLKSYQGCGIIYASTRKNCEHLVELLEDQIDREIAFYHAGLASEVRRKVQERFMSGETQIIVATNAFGMGIDKADLRFVVHYNLPGSIEAYYQEAGRAGRDGLPSDCLLLYSFQDKFIQEFFIENAYPSRDAIRQVYNYLCSIPDDPIELTLQEVKEELGLQLGTTGIATCENLLEKAGAIERLDSRQNAAGIRIDSDMPTLIDFLPREASAQRHVLKGLEKIVGELRGERVMFQPNWLAQQLDMEWTAVNRAIRKIVSLPMIDYVPPFRGRAIHVIDRKKRFSELDIDFGELARRQKAEHEKLESVIRFATTRRCRQLEILEYFGDADRRRCGICDNCKRQKSKGQQNISAESFGDPEACLYAVQVALSGTARTHGRFGKTIIAQMLSGSTSKKIKQFGLSRLSTFGLLKILRQSDVVALMDFLIEQGYISQSENTKFRPTVAISNAGKVLISGESYIDFTTRMPVNLVSRLSTALKGKKPHLQVTEEATRQPEPSIQLTTTAEGPQLEADHSEADNAQTDPLENDAKVVEEAAEESDKQSNVTSAVDQLESYLDVQLGNAELPEVGTTPPNCYWTWRQFFVEGYLESHVCQSRALDAEQVLDHLIEAVELGLPVQLEWVLQERQIEALKADASTETNAGRGGLFTDRADDGVSEKQRALFEKWMQNN